MNDRVNRLTALDQRFAQEQAAVEKDYAIAKAASRNNAAKYWRRMRRLKADRMARELLDR